MEEDPKIEIKRKIKVAFKLGNCIKLLESDYEVSFPFYMGVKEARLHLRRGNVSDVNIDERIDDYERIIDENTDLSEIIITDLLTFCLYNLYQRTCIVSLPLRMATRTEIDIVGRILPNFTIEKRDCDSIYNGLAEHVDHIATKGEHKKVEYPILFAVQCEKPGKVNIANGVSEEVLEEWSEKYYNCMNEMWAFILSNGFKILDSSEIRIERRLVKEKLAELNNLLTNFP